MTDDQSFVKNSFLVRALSIFSGCFLFIIFVAVVASFGNSRVVSDRQKIQAQTSTSSSPIPSPSPSSSPSPKQEDDYQQIQNELWGEVQVANSSYRTQLSLLLQNIHYSRAIKWLNYAQRVCSREDCNPYEWLHKKLKSVSKELDSITQYGSVATNTETYNKFIKLVNKQASIIKALSLETPTPPSSEVPIRNYSNKVGMFQEAVGKYTNPALRQEKDYRYGQNNSDSN